MLPTLDEFIASAGEYPKNSYVREPGMDLYVRIGPRYIEGRRLPRVLDIARASVHVRGKGTFTRLVQRLRSVYPDLPLYAESVTQVPLALKLLELGFSYLPGTSPPCFIREPSCGRCGIRPTVYISGHGQTTFCNVCQDELLIDQGL